MTLDEARRRLLGRIHTMPRVLITTDYLSPGDEVDKLLRSHGHETVHSIADGPRSESERRALLENFDGALTASEPITAGMLEQATSLKVIARSGVGYDSIDVQAAALHGVRVCNTPGVNHDSVAELTMGLILATARRLVPTIDGVRKGQWPRGAGRELRGSTLGVLGYGHSGRAVVRLGLAFGMTVLVSTSHPDPGADSVRFTDRRTLLEEADYLSLHVRADPANHRFLNEDQLRLMKPSAVVINTARGSLVDEEALADSVRQGRIAGAALDVVDREPLPTASPLRHLDNVIITSHLAGQTIEARLRAGFAAARDVIAVLDGREPEHPVIP